MHKVKVVNPQYDQSRPYTGQVGEVIGHWGADNSRDGREGYLVEFPDGQVVGISLEEVETVT